MERNSYLIMIKFYKQIISKQTAQDIYHDFMGKIIKEHEEYVENEVPATSIDGETSQPWRQGCSKGTGSG